MVSGLALGLLYGDPVTGLLVAAFLALVWQVRQLLAYDRVVRTGEPDHFQRGDGIWQQLYSRYRFEHQKSEVYKRRYRDLLAEIRKSTDAMPDAAVVIDSDNRIVTSNRAAKELVGLRPKKDKGERIEDILHHRDFSKLLNDSDFSAVVDLPSPLRPGHWLNCRIVPYGVDQRLVLIRDITDRLRLNKMRRDFVANASHELRSPLTVISGYLEGLTDEDIPPDLHVPFHQMQSQARRMNQVINELLELSRVESAGQASFDDSVDVAGLMHAAAKTYRSEPGAPNIVVDADPTVRLLGNATQIESVITNFVSNAIRYTPVDGKIVMQWSAKKNAARLAVTDTGEGIPAKDLPRLTERFFRVDRGRARSDGGVGLGLAIVKHILSRHDTELQIESTPGVGSTFSCVFDQHRLDRVSQAQSDEVA